MHLTRSKYRKFYNEDRSSSSGYRNGEKTTPSKIIESTNDFAFTELIAEMDHGEHESAMKEFVTLHTEPREMSNLLSLVQPPLASPIASSGLKSYQANVAVSDQCNQRNQMNLEQNNGRYISGDVIGLNVDSSAVEKEVGCKMPVIILDLDEEDGGDKVGEIPSPTSELKPLNTLVWLAPKVQLLQATLSGDGHQNLHFCEKISI